MKNKTSILLITLLALSGLMVLATMPTTTQADEGPHKVFIGVDSTNLEFNVTSINLEKGTEYTIVFVNEVDVGHNLRIDVNDNIESGGDVGDTNDITVGLENDVAGPYIGTWEATWTTPNTDGEYIFYCGFAGHYLGGMEGTFIVGAGDPDEGDSPGFGAFAGIAALLVAAMAIPQLRRR